MECDARERIEAAGRSTQGCPKERQRAWLASVRRPEGGGDGRLQGPASRRATAARAGASPLMQPPPPAHFMQLFLPPMQRNSSGSEQAHSRKRERHRAKPGSLWARRSLEELRRCVGDGAHGVRGDVGLVEAEGLGQAWGRVSAWVCV